MLEPSAPSDSSALPPSFHAAARAPACPRCGLELAPCEGGEAAVSGVSFGAPRWAEAPPLFAHWACPEPYCSFAEGELELAERSEARRARSRDALEETQFAHEGSAWLQALRRAS